MMETNRCSPYAMLNSFTFSMHRNELVKTEIVTENNFKDHFFAKGHIHHTSQSAAAGLKPSAKKQKIIILSTE